MKYLFDKKGLSLVELMVTMAVVAVLMVAMGFSMQGWQDRYRVESNSHDMFTNITEGRAAAMNEGRSYFVVFPQAPDDYRYLVYRDQDGSGTLDQAADQEPGGGAWRDGEFPGYRLVPKTDALREIELNQRGVIGETGFVWVQDRDTNAALEDADYDCLDIKATRIKLGRWNEPVAGECNAR